MKKDPIDTNPKTIFGMSKPSVHAIPPVALLHCGGGMENGKDKYGLMNWREHSVSASIYYDAAFRHLAAWWDGEQVAPDSGVHHLGHVMACCAILLDAEAQGQLNDDRPEIPGKFAEMVARMTREMPIDLTSAAALTEHPGDDFGTALGEGIDWEAEDARLAEETADEYEREMRDLGLYHEDSDGDKEPAENPHIVEVRPGITAEKLRDKVTAFIMRDRIRNLAQWSLMQTHMGVYREERMSQAQRTQAAWFIDCREAGLMYPLTDLDDMLSKALGGEQ